MGFTSSQGNDADQQTHATLIGPMMKVTFFHKFIVEFNWFSSYIEYIKLAKLIIIVNLSNH